MLRRFAKVSTTGAAVLIAAAGKGTTAQAPADVIFGQPSLKPFEGNFLTWLEGAFAGLDKDASGSLSAAELGSETFALLDVNGDGKVARLEMTLAKALVLFKSMDLDGDGELTVTEVPQAFIDAVEIHDGFTENNDGKVDAVEFGNFHAAAAKARGKKMSWAEVAILVVAGGVGVVAVGLLVQSWRSKQGAAKEEQGFLGIEKYELEYPSECEAFNDLRDANETDEIKLKRALFKRALATVPMRLYVQTEERNVQRLYQNSMISPASWANFQNCIEEVKAEMEVIKEEAEALQPGWSESIVQEAHWLHQNVNDEKKVAAETQAKQKAQIEAMQKAQKVAVEAKKAAEPPKELSDADRAKVVKALEAEAEREAAKGGAVKRKGSGKDKGKK